MTMDGLTADGSWLTDNFPSGLIAHAGGIPELAPWIVIGGLSFVVWRALFRDSGSQRAVSVTRLHDRRLTSSEVKFQIVSDDDHESRAGVSGSDPGNRRDQTNDNYRR